MTLKEVKTAFVQLYGNDVYSSEFDSFDQAFRSAWDSFDYVAGASTAEDFAQAMTDCWQLTDG